MSGWLQPGPEHRHMITALQDIRHMSTHGPQVKTGEIWHKSGEVLSDHLLNILVALLIIIYIKFA